MIHETEYGYFLYAAKDIQDLVHAAIKAKDNAYCPYSEFKVGSAVLTDDGQIFSGKVNMLATAHIKGIWP